MQARKWTWETKEAERETRVFILGEKEQIFKKNTIVLFELYDFLDMLNNIILLTTLIDKEDHVARR